jgi:ribonuclease Z
MSYNIVHHPFVASLSGKIYEDKHLTVETIPLRHSVPVAGFIFREKKKPLNIRKEAIEKFNLGIRDIRRIKEGLDFTSLEGITVANSELTYPPNQPRSFAFCTDTSSFIKLHNSLKDIDLLYFEATFAEKDKKLAKITCHSTAGQAATIAKHSHVGKLLIGHFSTRYKNVSLLVNEARAIFPKTYAVEDGEKYLVNQQRVGSRA